MSLLLNSHGDAWRTEGHGIEVLFSQRYRYNGLYASPNLTIQHYTYTSTL